MTITVLLITMLTGANHTVVAEYDTPQACEAAAQAHQKVAARALYQHGLHLLSQIKFTLTPI